MRYLETGYTVTTGNEFLNKLNGITPELVPKLVRFQQLASKGKRSSIRILLNAIEQYPNIPHLKNYLSVLYGKLEETNKIYEVNDWLIAEHPHYLFGKLNKANEYFIKQEYDKMPSVLGDAMDLKALYPDRDLFHIDEVIPYFNCTVLYFAAIDNIEQAEIRYNVMHELDPDAAETKLAYKYILTARMRAGRKRYEEEQRTKISVIAKPQEIKLTNRPPEFIHQEIEWLYNNGLYIGREKLSAILSLPKGTLVQDLELVLQDSIDRFGYFNALSEEGKWDEEKMTFVIHAVSLLGELGATESIWVIFDVLSQSNDYLNLYFGDFVTSGLWEPLYKIASNQLEACKQFMFRPGMDTFARTVISEMNVQIAFYHPERRSEVLDWYDEVIGFFLDSNLEDNVIDSDLIGLMICDVLDIKGSRLLPQIEQLFEQEIVSTGICGNWVEVSEAFKRPDSFDHRREILSIADRYEEITSSWAGYNQRDGTEKYTDSDLFLPFITPVKAEPKIGRNEPCPCGSGKKYKKCCLNK